MYRKCNNIVQYVLFMVTETFPFIYVIELIVILVEAVISVDIVYIIERVLLLSYFHAELSDNKVLFI